jgi:hypothetical protein
MDLLNTNKYILKIDRNIYKDIAQGAKRVEYRKLNKDYIQGYGKLIFIDMKTMEELGEVMLVNKAYVHTQTAIKTEEHLPTKKFIEENYSEEKILIAFFFMKI